MEELGRYWGVGGNVSPLSSPAIVHPVLDSGPLKLVRY